MPETTPKCTLVSMRDRTGTPAVDFELLDAEGRTRTQADWHGQWLLLVFHRHLG